MNQPERMLKCKIVGSKQHLSTVISELYGLGLYHLTPHLKGNLDLDIGQPLTEAEVLSELLVKIRSLLASLTKVSGADLSLSISKKAVTKLDQSLELNSKNIFTLQKKVNQLYSHHSELEEKLKSFKLQEERLHTFLLALAFLKKTKVDVPQLMLSKKLAYFAGNITKTEGLPEAIQKVSDDCSLALNTKYILLVGKKSTENELRAVLNEHGFSTFDFNFNFKNIDSEIKKQKIAYHQSIEQIKLLEKQKAVMTEEVGYLTELEFKLSEEIRKQELPLSFAVTKSAFVAEGWVPKNEQAKIERTLLEATKSNIHVVFEEPGKKEEPPVRLNHSKLVTPFEFLLTLYNLPKYREIDPTSILFFTFPIFFGMMLGDIGYGLVLLFLFAYLKKKIPAGKQLLGALMFAAIISMFFGLAFGEVFGFESVSEATGESLCHNLGICLEKVVHESQGHSEVIYEFPRLLNRAGSTTNVFGYEVMTILVLGTIIGFFHLNLGYLLGFYNELKSHGFKHAFLAKLSWIILQAGIIIAVLALMGILTSSMSWVGIIVAVLGIVFLGMGEGIQGIVELPSIFSNVLSYMRLGAVGLASVGLAVVVNEELALPFIHKGGIFIIVGILIMLIGHTINLLLGVLGPFLHGVRLHYVECFSKFFHGGGVEYTPFAKKKLENEEN